VNRLAILLRPEPTKTVLMLSLLLLFEIIKQVRQDHLVPITAIAFVRQRYEGNK
jgi:hypothetical protein